MKNIRRIFSIICMIFVMALVVPVAVPQDLVPESMTAEAATVKINKTSATLYLGKTLQLKMLNTSKKVTWTTSSKSIATVSSTGKVTPKKCGNVTITAKVGTKKYKCYVTVKINSTTAVGNLSISYDQCRNTTIAKIKNNNSYAVALDGTMVFYDESNIMIGTSSDSTFVLPANTSTVMYFYHPYDENTYEYIAPNSYKLKLKATEPFGKGYNKKISTEYDFGTDGIVVSCVNNGDKELDWIKVITLMYDENGDLLSVEENYADCKDPGEEDFFTAYYPYDEHFDTIMPASCKVIVSDAYVYNW